MQHVALRSRACYLLACGCECAQFVAHVVRTDLRCLGSDDSNSTLTTCEPPTLYVPASVCAECEFSTGTLRSWGCGFVGVWGGVFCVGYLGSLHMQSVTRVLVRAFFRRRASLARNLHEKHETPSLTKKRLEILHGDSVILFLYCRYTPDLT